MRYQYYNDGRVRSNVVRDAHDQSKIYVDTKIHDKPQLEQNARIRNEALLPSGADSPLMDGDVIAYAFSFPTYANFVIVKRDQPDLMHQVTHGTDTERLAAGRKLAILYPEYVITHHKKRIK